MYLLQILGITTETQMTLLTIVLYPIRYSILHVKIRTYVHVHMSISTYFTIREIINAI